MSCTLAVRLALRGGVLVLAIGSAARSSADESLEDLRPFFETWCHSCHGPDVQKNDLRLDTLGSDLSDPRTLELWQEVLDQLQRGDMPPMRAPQPESAQTTPAIETLSVHLRKAWLQRRSTGSRTVLRRLNRIELRNTLRDLLYLDGPDFHGAVGELVDRNGNGRTQRQGGDPVRNFPPDEQVGGFDNIGDRLVLSDFLLQLILRAAEESLERATHFEERPSSEPVRYAGPIRTRGPNPGLQVWSREVHRTWDGIFERYREPGASTGAVGRVAPDDLAQKGVGSSGRYRITVEASAHNQLHPWGELVRSRQEEALILGVHVADARQGGLHEANSTHRQLVEWTLPGDGSRRQNTYETWLDAGWFPWLGWENGPYDRSLRPSHLVERYLPDSWRPKPGKNAPREEREGYEPAMARALFESGYDGPHIRVHAITVELLIESWPPRGHVFLYGESSEVEPAQLLLAFARRAFRSPVEPVEIEPYVTLVDRLLQSGTPRPAALRVGYTAAIASPRFCYLHEPFGPLGSWSLASRLSYFLWSSMPDERLFELAAADRLIDPAVLGAEVDRMLDDPRASEFTRRFTARWLRLDRLGAMPPERGGPFRIYWDRQLESQMIAQTDAFFSHLVRSDGPVRDLIDSDYSFLNERVASLLYDRDDVWGDGFRRVAVVDPRRGGIFTQPAVMTATANGVDTSPIVRGVWVLENVLGTPPSPPPPDVEPLAPDLRGTLTLNEQLAKHRESPACDSCHRKIDPLGFPLESFDPIGRLRERYAGSKQPVEVSAKLAGGREIADVVALKRYLLTRERDVTRCLTEKLLTYATGRLLEASDRGEVERIVATLESRGTGVRDLIRLVVGSRIFRTK